MTNYFVCFAFALPSPPRAALYWICRKRGQGAKGNFRNLINAKPMQQTDLDIAKPLFKTDLGHGRGVGGGVRMSTRRVLYKNARVQAAGRGQHDKLQLHLAYKTINTFTMHQTNFINNILTSCPARSGITFHLFSFFVFFFFFCFVLTIYLYCFYAYIKQIGCCFSSICCCCCCCGSPKWLTCRNCCSPPR